MRKKLAFLDTSLDDLRAFPESSRQEIGYQLARKLAINSTGSNKG